MPAHGTLGGDLCVVVLRSKLASPPTSPRHPASTHAARQNARPCAPAPLLHFLQRCSCIAHGVGPETLSPEMHAHGVDHLLTAGAPALTDAIEYMHC